MHRNSLLSLLILAVLASSASAQGIAVWQPAPNGRLPAPTGTSFGCACSCGRRDASSTSSTACRTSRNESGAFRRVTRRRRVSTKPRAAGNAQRVHRRRRSHLRSSESDGAGRDARAGAPTGGERQLPASSHAQRRRALPLDAFERLHASRDRHDPRALRLHPGGALRAGPAAARGHRSASPSSSLSTDRADVDPQRRAQPRPSGGHADRLPPNEGHSAARRDLGKRRFAPGRPSSRHPCNPCDRFTCGPLRNRWLPPTQSSYRACATHSSGRRTWVAARSIEEQVPDRCSVDE